MTIAATYPAAVIGMAVLRLFKGSVLEENFARTVGSIGESVAAGAIFTIPAFVILKLWTFDPAHMWEEYLLSAALMILGGILGIMFVTVLRRVMVEDPGLPFPESVAASEIHKAGQRGTEAAMQLFKAMGVGAFIKLLDGLRHLPRQQRVRDRRRPGQAELRETRPDRHVVEDHGGRHHDVLGARRHASLPRRRLHHRPRAGGAELRRRAARLGPVRPAAHLLPGSGAD